MKTIGITIPNGTKVYGSEDYLERVKWLFIGDYEFEPILPITRIDIEYTDGAGLSVKIGNHN